MPFIKLEVKEHMSFSSKTNQVIFNTELISLIEETSTHPILEYFNDGFNNISKKYYVYNHSFKEIEDLLEMKTIDFNPLDQ